MSLALRGARCRSPHVRNRQRAVWITGLIIACGALLGQGEAARAQSITIPAGPQTRTHNGTNANQVFTEVIWRMFSVSTNVVGCTTQWSCGPFTHTGDASFKADSRLVMRITQSSGSANWTAIVPSDQTNFGSGDLTATVVARSSAVGSGRAGLTVTFVDNDFSRLAAGNYTMTVTGTITGN